MAISCYHWLSLAISGYLWLYLAISGYPWLSLAITGYHWLFVLKIRVQVEAGESKLLLFETFSWNYYFFLLERFLEELALLKITRRTTGARGCYFQTSVYQVMKSKFQSRYDFNMLQVMRKYHILCLLTSVRRHVSIYKFCLQVSSTKYQVKSPSYRVAKWGRKDIN